MEKLFHALDEPQPGAFCRKTIEESRDFVAGWFGKADRVWDPEQTRRRVAEGMPEMLGIFDTCAGFAGDDPVMIAAIAGIDPPPLIPAGCTVRAFTRPRPTMLRNYDFHPEATQAVILRSHWNGRGVLGTAQGATGLLDGVNEAGIAAALTFGGRHVYGTGFGIVMVIRYLLQVARTLDDAAEVLRRVPVAWAHNVLVQDAEGRSIRAEVAPDREPLIVEAHVATNHQANVPPGESSRWRFAEADGLPDDAEAARTVFASGKLCLDDFDGWLGTLYTAEYRPEERAVIYHWGADNWRQSLDAFEEGTRRIAYAAGAAPRLVT